MPARQRLWLLACLAAFTLVPPLRAGSSNSLMDASADGKRLLAANNDNGTVTLIDTTTRRVVREIPVGRKPEGISWIGPGPLALVTLYEEAAVLIFDSDT